MLPLSDSKPKAYPFTKKLLAIERDPSLRLRGLELMSCIRSRIEHGV
jgi:hypothetical protein